EEFLPGKEVTVDGVTLFGRFHLAGVTNKMQMPGPYFEEDYYTLPFRTPEEEPELVELVQAIVDGLGVRHCLFNAEVRQDAAGAYHVVEFSTRLSGGQNYRCLRDVYAIDPVRLYLKAILAGVDPALEEQVWAGELRRQPPRMATCIKYAYRSGVLMRNNAGEVMHSPYFRSYLTAARPRGRAPSCASRRRAGTSSPARWPSRRRTGSPRTWTGSNASPTTWTVGWTSSSSDGESRRSRPAPAGSAGGPSWSAGREPPGSH